MSVDRSQIPACGRLLTIVCVLVLTGPQLLQAQVRNDLVDRLENAATLIRDDRLAEAERQLSAILKINLNQPDALNLLGAIRAKQRRLIEAERLFSRAISANTALVSARMNLVQLHLIQNRQEKAISELNQVLRLQPEHQEALDRLSRLLLSEKRFDEFIALMERNENARSLSFSMRLALAEAYLEKRDAEKAERNFRLALEQQSDDADTILGLAQVAYLRGDTASASSYLDHAKKSPIKSAETLYKFGMVASLAERYEEANLALSEAVKLKPDEPAFHVALGTTWLKKPDLVAAEQSFRRALQLQSDSAPAQMYLGYTLMLQGQHSEARQMLEKSLARQPAVPQIHYYLGLISQDQGDDQAAVQLFQKTLQLLPSFTEVHVALGRSYLNLKDYPQAQAELELAVKLNPKDSQAHYQLAVLYARLKDSQRSQQHMQIVERLKEAANPTKRPAP